MRSFLANLLKQLFGESIARALAGAGLALATSALLIPLVLGALNGAASAMSGVPADMLNVCLLFGFGEAMSIIGGAMLTRLYINSTNVGIKKASGGASA